MTLALHAAAQCELSEAEGHSDAERRLALATEWKRLEEPYREAQARLSAAALLLRSSGDRTVAAQQLDIARKLAERIGAQRLAQAAEEMARRARITLHRDSGDATHEFPYRLTPRERDVLALVAEGLTDRSIGSRLFISHRTVERHVSNLLAKLNAARRSELAAIAHREGLAFRADSSSSRARRQ